jgi:hypothetical protein
MLSENESFDVQSKGSRYAGSPRRHRERTLLGPRDTSLPRDRGSGSRLGHPAGGGRTGLPKVLRGGDRASGIRRDWRQE